MLVLVELSNPFRDEVPLELVHVADAGRFERVIRQAVLKVSVEYDSPLQPASS